MLQRLIWGRSLDKWSLSCILQSLYCTNYYIVLACSLFLSLPYSNYILGIHFVFLKFLICFDLGSSFPLCFHVFLGSWSKSYNTVLSLISMSNYAITRTVYYNLHWMLVELGVLSQYIFPVGGYGIESTIPQCTSARTVFAQSELIPLT